MVAPEDTIATSLVFWNEVLSERPRIGLTWDSQSAIPFLEQTAWRTMRGRLSNIPVAIQQALQCGVANAKLRGSLTP